MVLLEGVVCLVEVVLVEVVGGKVNQVVDELVVDDEEADELTKGNVELVNEPNNAKK